MADWFFVWSGLSGVGSCLAFCRLCFWYVVRREATKKKGGRVRIRYEYDIIQLGRRREKKGGKKRGKDEKEKGCHDDRHGCISS